MSHLDPEKRHNRVKTSPIKEPFSSCLRFEVGPVSISTFKRKDHGIYAEIM